MSSTTSKPGHEPRLPALVRFTYHTLTARLAQFFASSGFHDLQPAHTACIQPLWSEPEGARLTTLARKAAITKQSMSALVDHLEAGGYVERVADPDDARASRIRLTARGRAVGRALHNFGRELEADLSERVGARRVAELHATLAAIRESFARGED